MTIDLPADVLDMRDRGDDWAAWVDRLPALARDLLDEWELTVDGALMNGFCSLVVPVLTADGQRAVLKLHTDADDDESEFEHLALQHWHGNGTVLLLRADPRRRAMLLERLHPRDLTTIGDLEACEVVAGLYGRIHVPALPQLRTITSYVERWTADLEALPRDAPIPRRMREQCVSLARDLVADPASVGSDHPRRPAPPQRAGRRPRALAGDRPQADERGPALRAGADALEPVGRHRRRRRPGRTCGAASTPSSTWPGSTRTVPATGSWSGWCTTCRGRSSTATPTRTT